MGHLFDPSHLTFSPISAEGAPDREGFKLLVAGKRLIVWDGRDCPGSESARAGGFIFDPKRNAWQAIPVIPNSEGLQGMGLTAAGETLIAWGGCRKGDLTDCSNGGWVFDGSIWKPTPTEGAPSAR